jgi:hypothetical protein
MSDAAASPGSLKKEWTPLPFDRWAAIGWGLFAGILLRLLYSGMAGAPFATMLSSFILGTPILVGFVTVYMAERQQRRTWSYYFLAPFWATVFYVLGALMINLEGWICAIVIFPLFASVGGLAGLVMGALCRLTNWPRPHVVGCVALFPLFGGAFEHHLPNPDRLRTQTCEVFVDAPAARVWQVLVDTRDIRREEVESAWMYRIGVPVPTAGAGDFLGGEHLRHITMGRGVSFDQVAVEWLENQRVTWRYRFRADSFPAGALDDHVRIGGEYFDLGDTTYELQPEGAGTRLRVQFRYRVSTHFNWYAGPVADLLVGNFAETILDFYGRRAARQGS